MRWIKVETHLPNKSEIVRIAQQLNISPHEAAGRCLTFWSWADAETEDGRIPKFTTEMVDRVVEYPGFSAALMEVNWLRTEGEDLVIPNFMRHNGKSAKRRASDAKRRAQKRGTY